MIDWLIPSEDKRRRFEARTDGVVLLVWMTVSLVLVLAWTWEAAWTA